MGDRVLVEAARRMRRVVRAGDLVGRLAGDEFVILSPGPITPAIAASIAERIRGALLAPHVLDGGGTMLLDVSIGVVVHPEGSEADVDDLLHRADAAMYRAKRSGGGMAVDGQDPLVGPAPRGPTR